MERFCRCGKNISDRGSSSFRCKKCQREYNNEQRRKKRRKQKRGIVRLCAKCFIDINDMPHNAFLCENCRKENKIEYDRDYHKRHKRRRNSRLRRINSVPVQINMDGIVVKVRRMRRYGGFWGYQLISKYGKA